MTGHSSRAGAVGTCQAWCGEAPPRCCSPCPQRAILQWDSSPARRSATQIQQQSWIRHNQQQYFNTSTKDHLKRAFVLYRLLSTCEVKSCCWSCRPSLKSQERTVLSSPPVHSLVPSWEMSIQLAPSVWPWNCLEQHKTPNMKSGTGEKAFPTLTIRGSYVGGQLFYSSNTMSCVLKFATSPEPKH